MVFYKIIIDNSMSNDFIKVVGTNKELYFDKISRELLKEGKNPIPILDYYL